MRFLRSLFHLAIYFNLHWLRLFKRRLFGPRRELPLFKSYYEGEGLGHFTPEDRQLMDRFSRCLACSWCESGKSASWVAPGAMPPSPSVLAISLTRDISDFPHLGGWRSALEKAKLGEITCPFGVPLVEGMAFLAKYSGDAFNHTDPKHADPKADLEFPQPVVSVENYEPTDPTPTSQMRE